MRGLLTPRHPLYGALFLLRATSAGGDADGEPGVLWFPSRRPPSFLRRGQLISKTSLRLYLHSWESLHLETREHSCDTLVFAPGVNKGMCQGEHDNNDNNSNNNYTLGWLWGKKNPKNAAQLCGRQGTLSPGARDRNVDSFVCIRRGDQVPE